MQSQAATPRFAVFDDYRPTVTIVVAVRWVLLAAWFVILHYRVDRDSVWVTLNSMGAGLTALNVYMTWLIVQRKPIRWQQAFFQSVADLAVITAGLYVFDGYQNGFYIFYYPALLGISLLFPGRVSFGAVAVVIVLYIVMAFTITPSNPNIPGRAKLELALQQEFKQEKVLFGRIMTMLGMVAAGTLISGWERTRRREAVAAERERSEENLQLQRKAQASELAALEERSRISREIHDGIAQSIYMLSLNLETSADLIAQERQDLKERLAKLVGLSKETLLEVRHYIFDLKPYLAGEKGVVSMLENQIREFSNVAGVATTLETMVEECPVSVATATGLYRITQEALSNALKHAQASKVNVSLEFVPDGVEFRVQDDGRGFDPAASVAGHGLRNMRQRAEELGGAFSLESSTAEGTQVIIKLPC